MVTMRGKKSDDYAEYVTNYYLFKKDFVYESSSGVIIIRLT